MKPCIRCGAIKPLNEFHRASNRRDGYKSLCKLCAGTYNKEWQSKGNAQERWRNASKKYDATTGRQRKYGITEDQYNQMRLDQQYRCMICGIHEKDVTGRAPGVLHVDHCHTTGEVRGLLCNVCNSVLGLFRDDPDRFAKAANYLRKARTRVKVDDAP